MKLNHFTYEFLSKAFGLDLYEIHEFFEVLEKHKVPYADIQDIIRIAAEKLNSYYSNPGRDSIPALVEALIEKAGLEYNTVDHDGFLPRVSLSPYYWQLYKPWDSLHRAAEEFFIVEPGYLDDGPGREIEVVTLLVALPKEEWLTVGGRRFPLFREYKRELLVLPGAGSNIIPTAPLWEWIQENSEPGITDIFKQLPSLVARGSEEMEEKLKQALVKIV